MKRDLTKGSVHSNLIYMALPAILGQLVHTLYDLVDMFWIGKISAQAVAAVTLYSTLFFVVSVFNSIIGISSISLISQNYGSGNKAQTARVIEQTLVFKAIIAGATMAIIIPLFKPLLTFFTHDATVIAYAMQYSLIRLLFLPIQFSASTLATAMRCIGDSRKPMFIMIMASVMNIILDPLFMFKTVPFLNIPGLGLGVFGAALATCLSSLISLIVSMIIMFGGFSHIKITFKGLLRIDAKTNRKLILIGLPIGIEMLSREFGNVLVMKFLSLYGTSIIATFGIIFRLTGVAYMISMGLHDAGGTITGQNLGAENIPRAQKTAVAAAKMGIALTLIFLFLSAFFAPEIIRLFVNDTTVVKAGTSLLPIMMTSAAIFSICLGLGCVFTGSGYNTPFMISSVTARWMIQIPLLFIFVKILQLPFVYTALSFVMASITETIIISWYYYQGRWQNYRVHDTNQEIIV